MKTNTVGNRVALAAFAIVILSSSCGKEARMAKGFRLPEGDAAAGRVAFSELKCTLCHSVAGEEFAEIKSGAGFVLGGEVRKIKTYGELVTAVIDPKRHVAPGYAAKQEVPEGGQPTTPMPTFNSIMTVKQLSDIVTFLHGRYRETGPEFPDYPMMMP